MSREVEDLAMEAAIAAAESVVAEDVYYGLMLRESIGSAKELAELIVKAYLEARH